MAGFAGRIDPRSFANPFGSFTQGYKEARKQSYDEMLKTTQMEHMKQQMAHANAAEGRAGAKFADWQGHGKDREEFNRISLDQHRANLEYTRARTAHMNGTGSDPDAEPATLRRLDLAPGVTLKALPNPGSAPITAATPPVPSTNMSKMPVPDDPTYVRPPKPVPHDPDDGTYEQPAPAPGKHASLTDEEFPQDWSTASLDNDDDEKSFG